MYSTFKDAERAALDVIRRVYNGDKMGCVVTEYKSAAGRRSRFGFRFHDDDTAGKFVRQPDGTYMKKTRI